MYTKNRVIIGEVLLYDCELKIIKAASFLPYSDRIVFFWFWSCYARKLSTSTLDNVTDSPNIDIHRIHKCFLLLLKKIPDGRVPDYLSKKYLSLKYHKTHDTKSRLPYRLFIPSTKYHEADALLKYIKTVEQCQWKCFSPLFQCKLEVQNKFLCVNSRLTVLKLTEFFNFLK